MFEWDETVAFDEEAQYVGRICRQEDPNQVLVDKVPQHYKQYQNLFLTSTAEKLGPRRTFDLRSTSNLGLNPHGDPFTRCQHIS